MRATSEPARPRTFRIDLTPPTVIAISPGNGSGKVDFGETITLTFSEPLDPASVPATTTLRFTSSAGGYDTLDMPGISDGPVSTGTTGYVRTGYSMAFNATVTLSAGDTVLNLKAGLSAATCSLAWSGGGTGRLQFVPARTLKDTLGNPAAGLTAVTIRVF